MSNFFEQELRKLFADGAVIHDPVFVGRACLGGLDRNRQVRAEFVTLGHADHYAALRLTLLDSLGKRIDFLKEVCSQLGLARVDCVHARAEEYAAGHRQQYDIAASRAVANLNVLCELALPLVKVGGQFLAMKSVSSDDEIAGARGAIGQLGGRIADIRDYTVPETQVRHRLVVIGKVKDTPAIYPRSLARIKKAPLK